MAIIPKSLRKNVVKGEMEWRQKLAREQKAVNTIKKDVAVLQDEKAVLEDKTMQVINKVYHDRRYLDKVYIPIGAIGGLIAVIAGGLYIISPWIALLYILLWSIGYFIINSI